MIVRFGWDNWKVTENFPLVEHIVVIDGKKNLVIFIKKITLKQLLQLSTDEPAVNQKDNYGQLHTLCISAKIDKLSSKLCLRDEIDSVEYIF